MAETPLLLLELIVALHAVKGEAAERSGMFSSAHIYGTTGIEQRKYSKLRSTENQFQVISWFINNNHTAFISWVFHNPMSPVPMVR